MKLLTKYNRINLVAIIMIFLLSGIAFYFSLNYIVLDQVDDDLRIEKKEVETFVKEHNHLPEAIPVRDQMIQFSEISQPIPKRRFQNLILFDSLEKEKSLFRQLIFSVKADGIWYKVSVSKSLEASSHLINSILLISFATIILILLATFLINRIVLKQLWKPFYSTLDAISNFKIGRNQKTVFPSTTTDEFSFMNKILGDTTTQAQKDYRILKEFTENAAHEMQTPLAVIRSKLDLLIQDEGLRESQSHIVQISYKAIERLSRLNHSLLLLAKIENKQFEQTQTIDLKKKLEEKTQEFQELWDAQCLTLTIKLYPVERSLNPELTEILLNNLLGNATRHNFHGGGIFIELTQNGMIVANTSHQPALDSSRLFTRFYKPSPNNESNGLGLSIIKQICEASGFEVRYAFQKNLHQFNIIWGER